MGGAEMPRQARHDTKRSEIVILSLSKDLQSGVERENWGMSNRCITCDRFPCRLYYHHDVRGPNQAEGGARPAEAALRCAEASLPSHRGPAGGRTGPEELEEFLPSRAGSVSLPSELPIRGMLDMPKRRDRD